MDVFVCGTAVVVLRCMCYAIGMNCYGMYDCRVCVWTGWGYCAMSGTEHNAWPVVIA